MIWDLIICIRFARAKASKSIKLMLDDLGLDLGLDRLHVFARAKFDYRYQTHLGRFGI
jgi:hypothetical protein